MISRFKKMKLTSQLLTMMVSALCLMAVVLIFYAGIQFVKSQNLARQTLASSTSNSVIGKIDRNFYERFGDVQAFAYNKLAVEKLSRKNAPSNINSIPPITNTLVKDSLIVKDTLPPTNFMADNDLQNFINTMTTYYVLYDLMMICDIDGNVIAANTINNAGSLVNTEFLLSTNFGSEEWFKACTSSMGIEGGAWYSDFIENKDVATIYNSSGRGMAFAAPIKSAKGDVIGVWYNFANWASVTSGIRQEEEIKLQQSEKESYIFVTNKNGDIIDAIDSSMVLKSQVHQEKFNTGNETFTLEGVTISKENYQYGWANSLGAYSYKGKGWNVITIIPSEKLTFATIFSKDLIGLIVFVALILVLSIFIGFKFSKKVANRINSINTVIKDLSLGELKGTDIVGEDEVGQMGTSVNHLTNGLKLTAEFADNIGKGVFNTEFERLSEKDTLGNALLEMRDNLNRFAQEDKKRNWATEGIAKFSETLRANENLETLTSNIIANLVKYIKANQGYLFLVNTEEGEAEHLKLLACYAYNKKRHLVKRIEWGEGITGAAWQDGDTVYLTEVPEHYVSITSGVGEALPRCVLIVPLKINEEIHGVIEIASFNVMEQYEITFVEKLAETIASTISVARINEKTRSLLEDSQQQEEELRAQEEEMRQNLEELKATQEEMQRNGMLTKSVLNAIDQSFAYIEFDTTGYIITANENFLTTMEYTLGEVKGKHHRMFVEPSYQKSEEYLHFWTTLANGKQFSGKFTRISKNGKEIYLQAVYSPVYDNHQNILKIIKIAMII
jgi:PAS domain S-box-containing protein